MFRLQGSRARGCGFGGVCPASSAAVERLFSSVGIAFGDKRKSSHADTVEQLIFARSM